MRGRYLRLELGLLGVAAIASSAYAYRASTNAAECCAHAPSRVSLSGEQGAPPVSVEPPVPATSLPVDMAFIPGGTFWMGSDDPRMPDARPWHEVAVDGFWMDRTEVTNEQFMRFVDATGYVTTAERPLDATRYPGAPAEAMRAAGIVFMPPDRPVSLSEPLSWWRLVPGASFRHPEGPTSSIAGREHHPVVHVSWDDAVAYAKWAGKRLPTEAEWEMAARGGLVKKPFVWGDELRPKGRWLANVWQGDFPTNNTREDGFERTAPVGSFPPNAYGLFDMAGNVWEWTADWYRPDYYRRSPAKNPRGPDEGYDPVEPSVPKRVTRGGSFLCAEDICRRYQPGGRGKAAPDSGTSHTGFRCVRPATAVAPR
jgi:formylglycine-generating enzyme required for sulfatase activity